MRKFVTFLIVAVLAVSMMVPTAFAAGTTGYTQQVAPGETVTLVLNVDSDITLATFHGDVSGDVAVIAVSSAVGDSMLDKADKEFDVWNATENKTIAAGSTVVSVTVEVPATAKPGDEIPVSVVLSNAGAYNAEGMLEAVSLDGADFKLVIPCNHSYTNYVYNNDATCGVDGTETATCDICGKVTDTRTATGTALTHSFTNYVYNNDAECEKDGTETATCDNGCGETDVRTATGTALTHSFTKYVYNNDAECEKDGTETATCDNGCGETDVRTATGTALVHKWTNDDKAPTCTEDGVKDGKHCELCGEIVSGTVLPATGHDYEGVVTKEPTCTEKGVKTYTCKNDAKHTYTEDIDPLGHKWDKGVVTKEPTCGEEGEMLFTCQNDKTHTKTEPIKKLEHDADELEYIDNKDGTHDVYCPGCDSLVIDNEKHMDLDKDGKCDGCGAKMPEQPTTKPTEDDKKDDQPKNGDITPYPVYFLMAAMAIVAVAYGLKRKFDI